MRTYATLLPFITLALALAANTSSAKPLPYAFSDEDSVEKRARSLSENSDYHLSGRGLTRDSNPLLATRGDESPSNQTLLAQFPHPSGGLILDPTLPETGEKKETGPLDGKPQISPSPKGKTSRSIDIDVRSEKPNERTPPKKRAENVSSALSPINSLPLVPRSGVEKGEGGGLGGDSPTLPRFAYPIKQETPAQNLTSTGSSSTGELLALPNQVSAVPAPSPKSTVYLVSNTVLPASWRSGHPKPLNPAAKMEKMFKKSADDASMVSAMTPTSTASAAASSSSYSPLQGAQTEHLNKNRDATRSYHRRRVVDWETELANSNF
ncbi:hypothetical protein J3R30DRAFT_3714382 [Lentinula aciculospora]|uniref:Uncharacterized protein n=1 Tax=Lentinula aciculospora TaxID=153920 RepID=A0A9W8ZWK0_9AGAR|nr:hypothetical protein J3R30DRAFT_3714382 [Lentinula aciculospora]